MAVGNWRISGPDNFIWTPDEIAQISRAAQAFVEALPNAEGKLKHFVSLHEIGVLDGSVRVTWKQPGDEA